MVLLLMAWSFIMALPAISEAGQMTPGCDYKFASSKCDDDGDRIVVVEEPAGDNCPAGGVKIIVFKDDHDYDWKSTDHSHHNVFFVCNGEDGAPGPPGAPGENGTGVTVEPEPAGANCPNGGIQVTPVASDGTLGNPFFVCSGADGAPGPAGAPGPVGVPGPTGATGPRGPAGVPLRPRTCVSNRVGRWVLIVRKGHRVTRLRAWADGNRRRATVRRGRTRTGHVRYIVRANFRGIRRSGTYVARVRYRVDGRRNTKIHYFRICMGSNPLRGLHEGLNRFPVTIL